MVLSSAEKSRRYRERHPERFRQSIYKYWAKPFECPCGSTVKTQHRKKHLRTAKHTHMMEYQDLKRKLMEKEQVQVQV